MTNENQFDFDKAFSRNIGWLTASEQKKISQVHVGIIGMGGVGGQYAEILTRLGVCHFTICDGDSFSVENTNRQNECKTSNYGRIKSEVISELIKDINPQAKVNCISSELRMEDVDQLCRNIDIYIDALDFFVIDIRVAIFRKMKELGKTAFTIAPIGAGAATLVFTKDSMSFDDYFGFSTTKDKVERSILFLQGVAPSFQHRAYVQEEDRIDFKNQKAPSLPMGVYACASLAATTLMKIVLGRGKIYAAPWSIHFDGYLMKIKKKYIWWGYRNPIQRLKFTIIKSMLLKKYKE